MDAETLDPSRSAVGCGLSRRPLLRRTARALSCVSGEVLRYLRCSASITSSDYR